MPLYWLLLAAVLTTPPAPQSAPAPDPGARAFQRCAACHSMRADDHDNPGPSLRGVFGRRAGGASGFAYSDALKAAGRRGVVWNERTLERYLADPEAFVPGTDMPYQGGGAAERAAVIDWLRRQR